LPRDTPQASWCADGPSAHHEIKHLRSGLFQKYFSKGMENQADYFAIGTGDWQINARQLPEIQDTFSARQQL
jgi:hypothetical protein